MTTLVSWVIPPVGAICTRWNLRVLCCDVVICFRQMSWEISFVSLPEQRLALIVRFRASATRAFCLPWSQSHKTEAEAARVDGWRLDMRLLEWFWRGCFWGHNVDFATTSNTHNDQRWHDSNDYMVDDDDDGDDGVLGVLVCVLNLQSDTHNTTQHKTQPEASRICVLALCWWVCMPYTCLKSFKHPVCESMFCVASCCCLFLFLGNVCWFKVSLWKLWVAFDRNVYELEFKCGVFPSSSITLSCWNHPIS